MTLVCSFFSGIIWVSKIDLQAFSFKLGNLSEFRAVITFNRFEDQSRFISKRLKSLFKASVTASDVCALNLNHKDILVCLSTIVRTEGSLSSFVPTTVSISQCPNSLRFSISFGRSSMLLPNTRLFFRTIVDFFFLPVFSGKSMFLIGRSPGST